MYGSGKPEPEPAPPVPHDSPSNAVSVPSAAIGYLKEAEAGVKAAAGIPLGSLVGIEAGAEATALFADYRVHTPREQARAAFKVDISKPARFVTKLQDVRILEPGEALAFRFAGKINADVTVNWFDVFTGQIGSLGKLLGTATPIAISFKAGATVALSVSVSDDFLIVFSRVDENRWRVGVRKVKSGRIAPSLDTGIDVGFANPKELKALASAALDGVLGAPLAKVKAVLSAASLESLGAAERKLAMALLDRRGLRREVHCIHVVQHPRKPSRHGETVPFEHSVVHIVFTRTRLQPGVPAEP